MTTLGNLEKAQGTSTVFCNCIQSTYNLLITCIFGFCCFIYTPTRPKASDLETNILLSIVYIPDIIAPLFRWLGIGLSRDLCGRILSHKESLLAPQSLVDFLSH